MVVPMGRGELSLSLARHSGLPLYPMPYPRPPCPVILFHKIKGENYPQGNVLDAAC